MMVDATVDAQVARAPAPDDRLRRARAAHLWLAILLGVTAIFSLGVGATDVSLQSIGLKLVTGEPLTQMERVVLWDIRLPRLLMGIAVGAALAVSGALMQGLFRNPLADPGLVGVSAGATLGAVGAIVLGASLPVAVLAWTGGALVPLAAFVGAWATMVLLYRIATRRGQTSVATMLLGGIAIAALTMALVGLLIFRADDLQLRELNFWQLGSLTGSSWDKLMIAGPIILGALLLANRLGRGLNGLALGEATASHLGFDVQQLKRWCVLLVAAATGAAVAVSGGIGFIGIVVPHILRLVTGPDHRTLLINAALLGATLLIVADMISRTIISPAELPIGIVTAVLGGPVFLWILLQRRNVVDL
ncbi:MAG: iron ABC transporter permease [Aestuariivita sp.]|jgi:iron complex transport system permease protein|nr:iron ABC transporter permease [Aestuariivita sp.]